MKKSRKKGAQGKRVPTAEEVDALCALPPDEFDAIVRDTFAEDGRVPPACMPEDSPAQREIEETFVSEQMELARIREANGGWLRDESWSRGQMTPEEEANRLVDEAIEADRRAAEG